MQKRIREAAQAIAASAWQPIDNYGQEGEASRKMRNRLRVPEALS